MKTVPERLAELGEIYKERNKTYGDNFLYFGKMMLGMFPNGLELKTEEDFNRFGIFMQICTKVSRYGQTFKLGHADSLDDIAVYAMMQRYVDGMRGS